MSNKVKTAISPTRAENYPEWYQQVIRAADMAEVSPVRGCMVIKPWGYALWENIQKILDAKFKATGHKNIYFPLFIPVSFLEREAAHIEGFAKECAVVTHHRLERTADGRLLPAAPLEEPLIVRPTSEAIIGEMFSKWIHSYRDLPLLVNQWANVVRWEMRTRLFLRTSEFLWQEGHTAHASAEEARQESLMMLDIYADFAQNYLAMPVVKGEKSESERFPGAESTYCIEAMMQDKKALQAGTSHFLGQNFSRAFQIKYLDASGQESYAWTTSWGVSTRLIGGLIMTHSDDNGLVLPPRIAPLHVIILPIIHDEASQEKVLSYCHRLLSELQTLAYHNEALKVEIDTSDARGGSKAWGWYKKGVPIRIEVGPKECDNQSVSFVRRDAAYADRNNLAYQAFIQRVVAELDDIQASLFARAKRFSDENTVAINSEAEFYQFFQGDEGTGGFASLHWAGDLALEEKLKRELSVTIRCIPLDQPADTGPCIFTGKASRQRVLFAKAY
jgi:prolyl-tRNA synthetase